MNSPSNMIKVAVVGGEGIGPEVTAQSHRVLNWFIARRNAPMQLRELLTISVEVDPIIDLGATGLGTRAVACIA